MRIWFSRHTNRRFLSVTVRIALGTILFLGGIWSLMHLPLFSIRSVRVAPASDADATLQREVLVYTENLLSEYTYGIRGSARYLFHRDDVEDMLKQEFLSADNISIDTSFFNIWNLTIKKRDIFGTACTERTCLLIDTKGIVFRDVDIRAGYTILLPEDIRIGGQYIQQARTRERVF